MDRNPHYFWAVRLPDAVKDIIFEKFAELKDIFPFKRWVHQDDYHITLSFLGSAEKQKLDTVVDFVEDAIKNESAFPLQIEGINTFGTSNPLAYFGLPSNMRNDFINCKLLWQSSVVKQDFR